MDLFYTPKILLLKILVESLMGVSLKLRSLATSHLAYLGVSLLPLDKF